MEASTFTAWADFTDQLSTRFDDLHLAFNERRLVAIIIGSIGSKLMSDTIVNRLTELHYRSGDSIDFYVVGWRSCDIYNEQDWSSKRVIYFDEKAFNECINVLSERFNWIYSGDVDLILMDGVAGESGFYLDDKYGIALNLSQRIADGTIISVNNLVESLVHFSKNYKGYFPIQDFVKNRIMDIAMSGIFDSIVDMSPKGLQRLFRNAIYLKPKDISAKKRSLMRIKHSSRMTGLPPP